MKSLLRPERLSLATYCHDTLQRVRLELHDDDMMFKENSNHYLSVGASALNCVRACQQLAGVSTFASILDFGSGAGRVTRWLSAAFPNASLSCADIRTDDLAFCANMFNARTWTSGVDIDAMVIPDTYDLIWVGSVLTHLSEENSIKLGRKLLGATNPRGVLMMSLHGRFAYGRRHVGKYIPDNLLPAIEQQYEASGYGYGDYPDQTGYGISFARPSWSTKLAEVLAGSRLILFSERAWDAHHDVLALQRIAE